MRDVVEFQIEEYAMSLPDETSNEGGAFGREQRTADFYPADASLKAGSKLNRMHGVVDVESD
jgi:hypothetical protein